MAGIINLSLDLRELYIVVRVRFIIHSHSDTHTRAHAKASRCDTSYQEVGPLCPPTFASTRSPRRCVLNTLRWRMSMRCMPLRLPLCSNHMAASGRSDGLLCHESLDADWSPVDTDTPRSACNFSHTVFVCCVVNRRRPCNSYIRFDAIRCDASAFVCVHRKPVFSVSKILTNTASPK